MTRSSQGWRAGRDDDKSIFRRAFDVTVKPPYLLFRDLATRFLEWRNGIETTGVVELDSLGLGADEDRSDYKPSEWSVLPRILPKREVSEEDVFIDFGSGLGRVVFQAAARYPFKRVIGVELSERLNDVAKANIERNRHRLRCRDVELVASDVLDYVIPDDVTIAYFANPFTGDIFQRVVRGLLASVDGHPRRLRIIYRNPVEHDFLVSTGRVRPVRHLRGLRPTREWSRSNSTRLYEVTP